MTQVSILPPILIGLMIVYLPFELTATILFIGSLGYVGAKATQ